MKTFLLIAFTLAISLSLASCFGSGDDNPGSVPSPIQGGIVMYNSITPNNVIASDPATIAFRLNILLATAKVQEVHYSMAWGTEGKMLTEILFGNNTISNTGNIFSINFNISSAGTADMSRNGVVEIDMQGKLLEELAPDEKWTVSIPDGSYALNIPASTSGDVVLPYNNSFKSGTSYTITAKGDYTWNIYAESIQGYHQDDVNKDYIGDWNLNYMVSYSKPNMNFSGLTDGQFTLSGGGEGNPADIAPELAPYTYTISTPIVYTNSCGFTLKTRGVERLYAPKLKELWPATYPDDTVKIKWKIPEPKGEPCVGKFLIGYNGYIRDQYGNEENDTFY
jgi:hypothetical protein